MRVAAEAVAAEGLTLLLPPRSRPWAATTAGDAGGPVGCRGIALPAPTARAWMLKAGGANLCCCCWGERPCAGEAAVAGRAASAGSMAAPRISNSGGAVGRPRGSAAAIAAVVPGRLSRPVSEPELVRTDLNKPVLGLAAPGGVPAVAALNCCAGCLAAAGEAGCGQPASPSPCCCWWW
jgi:hypothetical protein